MDLPYIDARDLTRVVTYRAAVEALREAFVERSASAPRRMRYETGRGDLLLMPAWDVSSLGVKLVTVTPGNARTDLPSIHALYVLFDLETGAPAALVDGEALTAIRTAAVSALATAELAAPDARTLVVFGAGAQARAHVESIASVRPVEEVTIVARTAAHAEELAREMGERLGIRASAGGPGAIADADIVCTCTTSRTPVLDGTLLPAGAHVNAIGSYRPDARELDDVTMSRARVVVEDLEVALAEAGDVVIALERGALRREDVQDLGSVLARQERPGEGRDLSVFKSVGVAFEDLAIAGLAARSLAAGT